MELAPRYCRSCGSRILVKNVCHNCNNDPLKGDNYCYDCGALTPNADSCLKCGAKYKRNYPLKPVLVIGTFVVLASALAGYFISHSGTPAESQVQEKPLPQTAVTQPTKREVHPADTVVNNPVQTNVPTVTKPADTVVTKKTTPDSVKTSPGIFTAEELKAYNMKCSYFLKNQRSQVMFFIGGGSGYIKVNEKIYELKRKRKGVDLAIFGGNEYEATLTIDGLSGSAKEWLASCTLAIKDLVQNTTVKHKIYSPCIEL